MSLQITPSVMSHYSNITWKEASRWPTVKYPTLSWQQPPSGRAFHSYFMDETSHLPLAHGGRNWGLADINQGWPWRWDVCLLLHCAFCQVIASSLHEQSQRVFYWPSPKQQGNAWLKVYTVFFLKEYIYIYLKHFHFPLNTGSSRGPWESLTM